MKPDASPLDKALARVCTNRLAWRRAWQRQRGFAFWVRRVEPRLWAFWRAYEPVDGRPPRLHNV